MGGEGSGHPCVSLMGGEGEWPSLCIIDGRGGGSGHPCVSLMGGEGGVAIPVFQVACGTTLT